MAQMLVNWLVLTLVGLKARLAFVGGWNSSIACAGAAQIDKASRSALDTAAIVRSEPGLHCRP
jgi:hypothetical protein